MSKSLFIVNVYFLNPFIFVLIKKKKKKKLILIALFLFSIANYAQNTAIPDPNFEKVLIKLGIDSGPINGEVATSSIKNLTILSIPPNYFGDSNAITDLTGIEGFTSLTKLYCDYQKLTRLNLTANTNLTQLVCNDNLLTNLDITKNTKLTDLSCFTNKITALDLSKNTLLRNLNLDDNLISIIDISNNTLLESFFVR